MVHFSKLKLYGFKSFVDKTELEIGVGLNGIVGPNGCGKSNLVEALRWVMGEKSAKNMRGGGMEDVIFAGTSKRPPRNLAEVTVVMNNDDGTAPAPFNTATEIEINRKIERDKGSQYRVNGKAVRARDVNLLFADTMTGANSPALVSQGRITEIIVAKPADRRRILEESAGISGLHTRRHEAELRLRAAEQNLTRLNDTLNDMRTRLSTLKRQARQAERYKELNDQIRRLDMALSWSEWTKIHSKIRTDRQSFTQHNELVQAALLSTQKLTSEIESLEESLPTKRKDTMEAQAILQNFRVSLERLEQDIQSKAKGLQDAIEVKNQLENDSAFTQSQHDQIITDMKQAESDLVTLTTQGQNLPEQIANSEAKLQELQSQYRDLNTQKQSIETDMAVTRESQANLDNNIQSTTQALEKINTNVALLDESILDIETKITTIESDPIKSVDIAAMTSVIEKLRISHHEMTTQSQMMRANIQSKTSEKDSVSSDLSTLKGEYNGLQSLLALSSENTDTPQGDMALINHLKVKDGYEKAVSSIFGQWLSMAGTNDNASVYWSPSIADIATPYSTQSILDYIDAPQSLHPLLKSVGVVDALPIKSNLSAGQMIVAKDGSFIRWDGLIVKATAIESMSDQTSMILEQKNRTACLETDIKAKEKQFSVINAELEHLQTTYDLIVTNITKLNNDIAQQENELRDTQYQQNRLNDMHQALIEKRLDCQSRIDQNNTEKKEIQSRWDALLAQKSQGDETALAAQQYKIDDLNTQITAMNVDMDLARSHLANFKQTQSTNEQNIRDTQSRIERYKSECETLNTRLDDFQKRHDAILAKIDAYKTANDYDTDGMREGLLSKIASQEQILNDLKISLDKQESNYQSLQTKLREAENQAATARENRAIIQTNVANSESELQRLTSDITEKFDMTPQSLEEQVYSKFENNIPEWDALHNEKDLVTRQRDGIGPVNLRAAIEYDETETQLAEMEREYNDLTRAIEQLRGGIAKLNREAKDRLAIAFQRVDAHFQRLFAQLFEGGKAYLEMIQSDDPLESGLEIYAEPPGKALQKLSLLSGGEQTLTATALIFAMFLTNPSPICVLDEIDAPLDDANVDRVCTLMENIARETSTRFIVITHHRMTMARMDRLYGVTMSERGVSKLVSVDMALQGEMELSDIA